MHNSLNRIKRFGKLTMQLTRFDCTDIDIKNEAIIQIKLKPNNHHISTPQIFENCGLTDTAVSEIDHTKKRVNNQ